MKFVNASVYMLTFINGLSGALNKNEGDVCKFNCTTQGVCKYLYQCPIVQKFMETKKFKVVTCGYKGETPIVCCPRSKSNLLKSTKKKATGELAREYCDIPRLWRYNTAGGGVNAHLGEMKGMAAVGWPLFDGTGYDWSCGGTLISEYFVLTAAHCTWKDEPRWKTNNPTVVKLGAIDLRKNASKDFQGEDVDIVEIFVHPQHNFALKYNDIALLKIAKDITGPFLVSPTCLLPLKYTDANLENISLFAFGWGETGIAKSSDILQKVEIELVDNPTCKAKYKTSIDLPNGITDSQICAGANGTQDTCRGDSGGPLVVYRTQFHFYLVGLTSFGVGCLGSNYPGVYTRVSSHMDWIESIVWV